ncbi:MAG: acetone carboxylase subunit alpha, partial [Gammaproteobacteria bacterium]
RAEYREQRKKQGVPYAEFVKKHVKSEPPEDIPFYGSWNSDMSFLYAGSNDDKRDPQNPGPVYFEHPKDVEIAKLEAELEAVREESGIASTDNRK